MVGILDALNCPEHGAIPHAGIHEAGHAAAAYDRDIPFVSVTVACAPQRAAPNGDETRLIAGGVDLGVNARDWMPGRAATAFEFALAGAAAEVAVFGHCVPGGMRGDMDAFRVGVGLCHANVSSEEITAVTGESGHAIAERVQQWARQNARRILRLADALLRVDPVSRLAVPPEGADAWILSAHEVARILARPVDSEP